MSRTNALRTLLLVVALLLGLVTVASATPPGIPSAATARTQLGSLRVAADGSMTGYSRDLFPHWHTVTGACNTREQVLKRDGTNVVTDSSCAATSGRWFSPYDGATWTAAADVWLTTAGNRRSATVAATVRRCAAPASMGTDAAPAM